MKRTKLSDRSLPDYTQGEEIMNMVTHIVGGALGGGLSALCSLTYLAFMKKANKPIRPMPETRPIQLRKRFHFFLRKMPSIVIAPC